jgi:RHS repeat-associated protein
MGNYEEENKLDNVSESVRKIHYICGGNGLAAVLVDNTLYYAHTDYQGSLIALSNTDGTVAERYAYDPWGNRRNPENWTQRDTRTTFLLNRGYTMHEHLDDFGLINMNGRVYDPLTAQFFSPDPYVQAPNNWLNYNRYSYAFGNPFRYTDPDGEFFLAAIFIGAFINTAMQGITGNLHNTGDFWKAFGIGALSGAAGAGAGSLASGAIHFGGFAGGSLIGAAGGAAGGFVGGAGNAWANGASFGNGLKSGLIGGGIGAIAGGLIGGITRGISDAKNGYDFWNGSRIDEFQIGDPLTSSENYVKQANEYNSSFEAEFDTENLQERMNRVFGIKKGNMNIQEITTQPTKGNYGLTSDGKYVKLSTGNPVGGYTITNSGDPFPRVHISPYYAKGDLVSFKVVAGHELIHAYHISVFPNFDRVYSERVAYKYSYDVLMNYGRFDSAMSLMNNAMSNSYWGASPSQYRKVPYLFFYFRF